MIVTAGSVNVSVYYYIVQDASATSPGEPVTGLLFSDIETGGSASYARQGAARVDLTLITLASASAVHADGGFILLDDTNMPGIYRCDYPDAAFATGIDQVFLSIVVASGNNAVAAPIVVEITDVDFRAASGRVNVGLWLDTAVTLGASSKPEIDMHSLSGTAQSADDLQVFADTGFDPGTNKVTGVVLVDTTTTNADMVAAAPTASANADAVWDRDATSNQTQGTFGQAIGDPVADTTTIYQSVATDATGDNVAIDVVAVKAETALIVTDTAEIGAAGAGLTAIDLPNQTMDITGNITGNLSGSVGSVTGAVGSVTGAVGSLTTNNDKTGYSISGTKTTLDALNDITTANVNTEVSDVLKTDVITLPGQEAPPLTPTFEEAIAWAYKNFRNRKEQTATEWRLMADNETTIDSKATVSDNATTAIKQEIVTGP